MIIWGRLLKIKDGNCVKVQASVMSLIFLSPPASFLLQYTFKENNSDNGQKKDLLLVQSVLTITQSQRQNPIQNFYLVWSSIYTYSLTSFVTNLPKNGRHCYQIRLGPDKRKVPI